MTTITEIQTTQVYQVFIKATPEQIWEAITKPEFTKRYFHGARIDVTPERYLSHGPNGEVWGDAQVAEFDPPRRLVHGWRSLYDPELASEDESRVSSSIVRGTSPSNSSSSIAIVPRSDLVFWRKKPVW